MMSLIPETIIVFERSNAEGPGNLNPNQKPRSYCGKRETFGVKFAHPRSVDFKCLGTS